MSGDVIFKQHADDCRDWSNFHHNLTRRFWYFVLPVKLCVCWDWCCPRIQLLWNDVILQRCWMVMLCCSCHESIFCRSWHSDFGSYTLLQCMCSLGVLSWWGFRLILHSWHDVISLHTGSWGWFSPQSPATMAEEGSASSAKTITYEEHCRNLR